MQNYVQEGTVVNHTAAADIAAGDVVTFGTAWATPVVAQYGHIGVAAVDIANGEQGAVNIEGVFALALKAGDDPAIGDFVFWDPTPGEITVTGPTNWPAGTVVAKPGGGIIHVKINAR